MSNNKNSSNDDESSSRVIDSFIRRAVDEGDIDLDDFDTGSKNVFWDRTTIRAALGGLAVLILVNLFFYYNMRLEQADNTSDWQPERRGFLVEYREGRGAASTPATSSASAPRPANPVSQSQASAQEATTPESTSAESTPATAEPIDEPEESSSPEASTQTPQPEQVATETSPEVNASSSQVSSDPALSPREQVRALVGSWAQAWTFKNVDHYLDHYSQNFISQGGAPFEPWAELRYERIEAPEWIHVSVDQLRVSVNPQSAVAEFIQVYTSSEFSSESRKTLVFEKEGDTWKIVRETVQPQ